MLRIKSVEKEKEIIELTSDNRNVEVRIDGEVVARFFNDGRFSYYGRGPVSLFEGRWT